LRDFLQAKTIISARKVLFKGKCRNCGKLGHKAAQCKSKQVKDEKSDIMCNYCKKSGVVTANCFKLLRKNLGMNNSWYAKWSKWRKSYG
jgi:Zinc knuckle